VILPKKLIRDVVHLPTKMKFLVILRSLTEIYRASPAHHPMSGVSSDLTHTHLNPFILCNTWGCELRTEQASLDADLTFGGTTTSSDWSLKSNHSFSEKQHKFPRPGLDGDGIPTDWLVICSLFRKKRAHWWNMSQLVFEKRRALRWYPHIIIIPTISNEITIFMLLKPRCVTI